MRLFALLILVGGLLAPAFLEGADAHARRTAITTVLFNPRTQNLEVMHRFHLHDAEHAVQEIFGKGADILRSDATRLKFSTYVAERFSLRNGDTGELISLSFVGHDVEGKFIWVYQEAPAPKTRKLEITHSALRDLWHDQQNTVNVEGDFGVKSAVFGGTVEIATIEIDP